MVGVPFSALTAFFAVICYVSEATSHLQVPYSRKAHFDERAPEQIEATSHLQVPYSRSPRFVETVSEPVKYKSVNSNSSNRLLNNDIEGQTKDSPFGPCKTCVYVLEKIRHEFATPRPSPPFEAICADVFKHYPTSYGVCHQVLTGLTGTGEAPPKYLANGCFKYEMYNAREWVTPCPTHVVCSYLLDLAKQPFCARMPLEDPFRVFTSKASAAGSQYPAPPKSAAVF